jgi:group II intron reverse transcriptase/maturase
VDKTKPFDIPKALVWKAFHLVKANGGSAGVDQESMAEFEQNLSGNLYKLWNRLSSGTYFPPPVKAVVIPKKQGGQRILGVPCVSDRIGQMAVKLAFEPTVEPYFLADSYGYRPGKSALDAVAVTRQRCWKYDFLLEFDIRGLFDNIDWELLMKAVRKHTENKWVLLYIERWLQASIQMPDGSTVERTCGTPQGGVISPVLSNLFLHYVFDMWMIVYHKDKPWCRYADDGIVHCKTEAEAQALLVELKQRFAECKLELHPDKTKIVYCKAGDDYDKHYPIAKFKFLGYEFRRRLVKAKDGNIFVGFTPAICNEAKKDIVAKLRKLGVRNRTELSIEEISRWMNPFLRGWINYYGKFSKSALYPVLQKFDRMLVAWAMSKYKNLRRKKVKACLLIKSIANERRNLFAHWQWSNILGFV